MVNRKKMSDLAFGFKKEKEVLELLKKRYGEKTIKQNSKYSTFDFETEDGTIQWELKSRRIKSTTYPTMMLSYRKLKKAQDDLGKKKSIILFNLNDGLFKWEYDPDGFEISMGGTMKRGCDERHLCGYIPVKNLKRFI